MLHTKFEKKWPGNFQDVKNVQLLRHDGPIAIDHLSDSGDLQSKISNKSGISLNEGTISSKAE